MNALAIQAVGALTPVGEDARATVAGLYMDLRTLRDLAVKRADGEPMTGAATPLSDSLVGGKRLFELASYAFHDATREVPDGAEIGLVVCAPSPDDEPDFPAEFPALCARLASETSLNVVARASRIFPSGRGAIFEALAFAQSALRAQAAPAMCVLGIDSLVAKPRLQKLVNGGIAGKEGFIPGEAAAAILLAEKPTADSLAILAGFGTADEPSLGASPAGPNLGKGLAAAIERAALDAKLPKLPIGFVVHDLPASPAACTELAWAKGCSVLSVPSDLRVLSPAGSVGEAGAAMGALSLLALAFLVDKGVVAGPGLCLLSTEGPRRGAAILLPSPYRKPSGS